MASTRNRHNLKDMYKPKANTQETHSSGKGNPLNDFISANIIHCSKTGSLLFS